jgi:hypothetical protein
MREQPWDNLKERGGTPFTKAHDPEGNWDLIDTAITSKDKVITSLGSAVDADGDYAARSTTNYIDSNSDIDEDLTDLDTQIKTNADGIAGVIDGTTARTGTIQNTTNVGTAGTNVTAVEHGDGVQHTTVLTLTNVAFTVAGAADEAIGALIYTFPAGVHLHKVSYMDVALQGGGVVDAATPDTGIGSIEATGAVAVLGGDSTFEDYIPGTAAADCNGTATVVGPVGATAGVLTDISLNAATDTKTVHLNIAASWAGADTVNATGTVVLEWTTLA